MFKNIILAGSLSFGVALNVSADDSAPIDKLKKEVQELKLRLSKLESLHDDHGEGQKFVTEGEGWKSIANWRKLTTGMDYGDVERILGKPERIDVGKSASWRYPQRGTVRFYGGKVEAWSEPRN